MRCPQVGMVLSCRLIAHCRQLLSAADPDIDIVIVVVDAIIVKLAQSR
jgi:hypothetical protein